MRVFGTSVLIAIPPDHMYVRTIPLTRCMEIRSSYKGGYLT